ncbi:hypothetical protein MCG44_00305 [Lawsonibacter sp. OA9]|nr:hypothetical protein [Lawsonibacter sp. OA9]MCH1978195.1 hypothetical protein [Lawsonibacter sp. OA9]
MQPSVIVKKLFMQGIMVTVNMRLISRRLRRLRSSTISSQNRK